MKWFIFLVLVLVVSVTCSYSFYRCTYAPLKAEVRQLQDRASTLLSNQVFHLKEISKSRQVIRFLIERQLVVIKPGSVLEGC